VSWLDRLATKRERDAVAAVQNAALSEIMPGHPFYATFAGGSAAGLASLTAENASTITAIHACWALISGAIAALPVGIYQRQPDGEREELHNEDLWWLLNEEFNPRWSAAKGWEFLVCSQLAHGDFFAIIERSGSRVIGLRPVHPQRMEVATSADGRRLIYRVTFDLNDGSDMVGRKVYDQDDIIHVPGMHFNGLRSRSPLNSYLRMAGSVALATQEYAARFFSNGARGDYVIKAPGAVGPTELADLRATIDERHGGAANAHRPLLLTGGMEVQAITLPLEDMQLLGLRQFQVEEIARVYLVPPFMIGANDKTTSFGAGIESLGKGFVRYTLRPHLNAIENEFNRKLYRTGSKFLAFDTAELERADMKSMFESFRIALGRAGEPAFMTSDEVRRRLNLKRTNGGDTLAAAAGAPTATEGAPA
jgi:HK97 family phage portal protein